jgi:hypothetical protein
VLFVDGVGLVGFGCFVMLGHAGSSFRVGLVRWMRMGGAGMYWVGRLTFGEGTPLPPKYAKSSKIRT